MANSIFAWEKIFSTNVVGVFHLTQLLTPLLNKSTLRITPNNKYW